MSIIPRVSIIVPLHNDESHVRAALDSLLAQTLDEIEIVCVDDSSTDGTTSIVQEYCKRDARFQLIRQPENSSAFQARRIGASAAAAPYLMFLDGDDELAPEAVATALQAAERASADVVGFGVQLITSGTARPTRFEHALQPRHQRLSGDRIVAELFPAGEEANGHIWRYLFATRLIRAAYEGITTDAAFYRANDLPITFLALAHARSYVSVPDKLYRYFFRRGTSGHAIDSLDDFRFLLSGIRPISAIAGKVEAVAAGSSDPAAVLNSYESARLHIIGNVLKYCIRDTSGDLLADCLALLRSEVGEVDTVRAAALFCNDALSSLSETNDGPAPTRTPPRNVLLTTAHLRTGGLQGVLLAQAIQLIEAGLQVTIAVTGDPGREIDLPEGATLVQIEGDRLADRLDSWRNICNTHECDVILDHHILYNEYWPWFALTALSVGVPTIGWLHNFALRPLFDRSLRTTFLTTHLHLLQRVITLSPTDVAFWKIRGVERVSYLPNPLSALALTALEVGSTRTLDPGPLEIVWWGRLDPATKRVFDLIETAVELKRRRVHFRMRIIGPDSAKLTAAQVAEQARSRDVDDVVDVLGERTADELIELVADAHLVVLTSAIEGSPLTILEAQALGLPIAMYELPWLTTARNNDGLILAPQGDPGALAGGIERLANDPALYAAMSRAAREFALTAGRLDVGNLLMAALSDTLPDKYSPMPSADDSHLLVEWLVRVAEWNINEPSGIASTPAEIASLRRERDRAVSKLRQIKSGPSYRLGRALTLVPRRLLGITRRHGTRVRQPASPWTRPSEPGGAHRSPLMPKAEAQRPDLEVVPDVSFIVPVFNSEAWITDCVSSVLAQSDVDVEVICIDDGSTDGSRAILQKLADTDPRVRVIAQPNSGQSVARNRGLEAAAGRYLIFLDSDDYWSSDALCSLVRRADEDDLDVVFFDGIAFRDGDVDDSTWAWYSNYYRRSRSYREVRSGQELLAAMRRSGDYKPHVGLYMTRTSFAIAQGPRFIPGIVHQDNPYTFALTLRAKRVSHEPFQTYSRRLRPGSTITALTAERSARGYFMAYIEMAREAKRVAVDPATSESIVDIIEYVYLAARKQFSYLTDDDAAELRDLDSSPDAQALWTLLAQGRPFS